MERVLLVDDEPNVVAAFKRKLSSSYDVAVATSASQAISLLKAGPTPAVVVSDMHMPGVQGVELLREISKLSPDTTRIMLTGLADQKTAARAINEGQVFRFLAKPCSIETLENAVKDGVERKALLAHERDLLQNTLGGVIRLLNDLLTFVDPDGIARAARMRQILREIGTKLQISTVELELAALLQGVGRLALPLEVLLKISQGQKLSEVEEHSLNGSVETTVRLLKVIPRFERLSQVLEFWHQGIAASDEAMREQVALFGLAAKIFDAHPDEALIYNLSVGERAACTQEELKLLERLDQHAQQTIGTAAKEPEGFAVKVRELCPGHRLLSDVKDKNGKLLLRKGFVVSPAVLTKVLTYHSMVGLLEPILVHERIPTRDG